MQIQYNIFLIIAVLYLRVPMAERAAVQKDKARTRAHVRQDEFRNR